MAKLEPIKPQPPGISIYIFNYMDLTILIPVKNEEDNINNLVNAISNKINLEYEILFIDDFSNDKTLKIIKDIKQKNKKIKLIENKKKGLGESIKNGIKFSSGKYVVITMCDGSDDLDNIVEYYNVIKNKNLDAVFGSRFLKKSNVKNYPKHKLILNRIFNHFVRIIYLNYYNDYTNAFKIYKKELLISFFPIVSENFNVFLELPLKIVTRKYYYKIIPINWNGRKIGVSKFKIKEMSSMYIFTLFYCLFEKILLNKNRK